MSDELKPLSAERIKMLAHEEPYALWHERSMAQQILRQQAEIEQARRERDACVKAVWIVANGESADLIHGAIAEPLKALQAEIAELRREHGKLWLIFFDDADVPLEVFSGEGAEESARARFEAIRGSWNATLFCSIDAAMKEEADASK
jgi:uncharacterized sporulation protein YeaH/YhbH (DUF444 family)